MKKIGFHCNQLSLRGTEVALYDYAHYNETLLGNESFIISGKHSYFSHPLAEKKFRDRFKNVFVYDNFSQVESYAKENNLDLMYFIKGGQQDGKLVSCCPSVVHVVFQVNQRHGNAYAYVSEWLSKRMTAGTAPFVPHMVVLPKVEGDLRSDLKIPTDATVYGRYGGLESFDLPMALSAVINVAMSNPNIYFIFMYTNKFGPDLPNLIFLDGNSDLEYKVKFINTCDAMIHARQMGESFGLAIGEFSHQNKPVLTWNGGTDRAHIDMLGSVGVYYNNQQELENTLRNFKRDPNVNYNVYSERFSPEKVMEKFNNVFIKPYVK